MTEYKIYSRDTGAFITSYRSPDDAPIDMAGYGIDKYDHRLQMPEVGQKLVAPTDPHSCLIDIGPYFDRFGVAKLPVLASQDPTVQAIVRDVSVRKWIDLQRPEVLQALEYIASKVPQLTPEIIKIVLAYPVLPQENVVLRAGGYIG